eukprot:TRINITY_DN685_c5_g1_i1.p1 TRINITY_DN685_c5_g1~~TRINITY_DN685_c5_g1_i1.p1  ORF type:complete len:1034 (+),score=328.47 TRINITY_DN685_c5_g1_i1:137-3238(+)
MLRFLVKNNFKNTLKTVVNCKNLYKEGYFVKKFVNPSWVQPLDTFTKRHIGSSKEEIQEMLDFIGMESLDDLTNEVIPKDLLKQNTRENEVTFNTVVHGSESEALEKLRKTMKKNKVFKTYIGQGFYDCKIPSVLQRNILENPLWYTPYTPYQAEISQGRLEALINFQTMVADLTGLKFSNASLLDEASAAAEAMNFCVNSRPKKPKTIFLSIDCHPQVIEVIKTKAEPLGINLIIDKHENFDLQKNGGGCGVILQNPTTNGTLHDYEDFVKECHKEDTLVCIGTDLLACTLMKSPGDIGADVAFGSAQRFGVPMGFGGPAAAFFSINDEKLIRKMPGRIVGVTKAKDGELCYRLTLQTREQHIKRQNATSNICTAQALLANMSGFFGVYHGPEGLRAIAAQVHKFTIMLQDGLKKLGHKVINPNDGMFDTIHVLHKKLSSDQLLELASGIFKINIRKYCDASVCISLDETTNLQDVDDLLMLFSMEYTKPNWREDTNYIVMKYDQQINVNSFINQNFDNRGLLNEESKLYRRSEYLTHPVFNVYRSETELLRYITTLQNKDISLATSMIPLGSCTMKLNAAVEMLPITWPEVNCIHPFAPKYQTLGYRKLIKDFKNILCSLTGMDGVTFQPNAGSSGEYTGLMAIRHYNNSIGQSNRNICLIPTSAHGTNPASAHLAGFKVVTVKCHENGYIDIDDLIQKCQKYQDDLGAFMVTYPSTYGVFEETITEVCSIIHQYGGQVYLDGANFNALAGIVQPGLFGADVLHLNLHKTFCIPHGGGGPGMGPVCCKKHLTPFLPLEYSNVYQYHPKYAIDNQKDMGPVSSAPFSSASILPISWMYCQLMKPSGLKLATQVAILNANYMKKKLEHIFPVLYKSKKKLVAHEFIINMTKFQKNNKIGVVDFAKRLIDYNFHAPTMSWPVPNSFMIEPTESESKEELDNFCDALISIYHEIQEISESKYPQDNNVLVNAPHSLPLSTADEWNFPYSRSKAIYPLPYIRKSKYFSPVRRVDDVYGDRNISCSCPPLSAYENNE